MLFDESDHFRRFGSSSDAKKLKRPSPTRWCRAAGDFRDATVRFLQQGPRALIPHPRPSRRAGLRPLPRRVPRDAQLWCHDLAGCLHGNVLRQNAIFYQAHDSVLRLLIKLLRQVRRFSHLLKRNKTWDTSGTRDQKCPRHKAFSMATDIPVYFAHPGSPPGSAAVMKTLMADCVETYLNHRTYRNTLLRF